MKQKMMFLALMLLVLSAASMNAQVTIGSTDDPHAGAVLDLQSTTMGFKLPNVALNDDLTRFVLPENETSTPENAAGMLVFNTNVNIGVGVYVWTGAKWSRMDQTCGTAGPDLVGASGTTYRTYIYPRTIGTWMITPSKEGTPDYKQYTGQTEGARGYYYKKAHYASACPAGWHVPTETEWTKLCSYLMSEASVSEYARMTPEYLMGGMYPTSGSPAWWGTKGLFACADSRFFGYLENGWWWILGSLDSDRAINVICVKNP
jgi:hypothetical protein